MHGCLAFRSFRGYFGNDGRAADERRVENVDFIRKRPNTFTHLFLIISQQESASNPFRCFQFFFNSL